MNLYVNAIHDKSVLGISPRKAISVSAKYHDTTLFKLDWENSLESSPIQNNADIQSLLDTAKRLGQSYGDVKNLNKSDLAILENDQWSNNWQTKYLLVCNKLETSVASVSTHYHKLCELLNLPLTSLTLSSIASLEGLAKMLIVQAITPIRLVFSGKAKQSIEQLELLTTLKKRLDELTAKSTLNFKIERVIEQPVDEWLSGFEVAESKFWPVKWFAIKKLKKLILVKGIKGEVSKKQLSLLNEIVEVANKVASISEQFQTDKIWQGWDTSPQDLKTSCSKARTHHQTIRKFAGKLDNPVQFINQLKVHVDDNHEFFNTSKIFDACESFVESLIGYKSHLQQFSELGGKVEVNTSMEKLSNSLSQMSEIGPKLKSWCEWVEAKKEGSSQNLNSLVEALELDLINPDQAESQTHQAIHVWLAPIFIDNSEVLRTFKTSQHEDLINEFRTLDGLVASTTSEYIASIVAASSPDPTSPQAPSEYGVLSRQFHKKSSHMPTRQLIENMGESMLHLTPCFMMSPLSVAQYLPADFSSFDLVIFDEASQITVWDAVGSIARGKNVIIVGDPKQMPPTNFFSKGVIGDSSNEEDLESILDQALSTRLPHHRLTGHYRSKHESLIAFSNSHYYQNSLVTFPSAQTVKSAVSLHRVDGLYSKGKNRNNIIEANAVADYIVNRLNEKNQSLSFGVVTLNSEQQRCIDDALDDRRRKYPDLEKYFQGGKKYDPVFVKNLESVQGDERDVIILSLGFGPSEPQAKTMSMNFGPLNKQGGERRLNVAITRATTEVHVFSSFDSYMIDLSRTSAEAVKHLKYFLEFAEKGPIALPERAIANYGVDQFDSDFEESVAFELRAKGWKVQTQVGVGKFRIDMGVVHPDKPGMFLAGIECDGATYHSSPSARDRDRIRHIVLENLGWNLLRIWSTDYFLDSNEVIENISNKLDDLLLAAEKNVEFDEVEHDDIFAAETEDNVINSTHYFNDDYQEVLINLAKEILTDKNGISLRELASDIADQHDLARTSKKQIEHIETIIKPWAGISVHNKNDKTIWLSENEIAVIIEWRGSDAFGIPRDWTLIPYPEKLGLAKMAIMQSKSDPIDFMFNEFNLSRKTQTTAAKFKKWLDDYSNLSSLS